MIYIRTATVDDMEYIEQILRENNLFLPKIKENLLNCMIALDNHTPVAVASFEDCDCNNAAVIQYVAVKKSRQGEYIGDGIVKSLVNLAEQKGFTKVFVISKKEHYLFFKKTGFKEVVLDQMNIDVRKQYMFEKDKNLILLEAVLPDFFLHACKSKQ